MLFKNILGNDSIKKYLRHMISKGSVGNSLLFAGQDGIGKGLFALEFAKAMLTEGDIQGTHAKKIDAGCHPDIHVYRPEGKTGMHSMDQLRRFSEEVYMYPYEAKKKVFIIHDAERMAPSSANALLKPFEEPSEDSLIILLSRAPEKILATILSRCRKVFFKPVEEDLVIQLLQERSSVTQEQAKLFARLSGGSVVKALHWAQEGMDPKREPLLSLLQQCGQANYTQVHQVAKDLAAAVEQKKDVLTAQLREDLMKQFPDPKAITASQKQVVEREVEGAVALCAVEEVNGILDMVQSWFRDLFALRSGLGGEVLFNKDHEKELRLLGQRSGGPDLDLVEHAVQDMQLALARSSALPASFESFFLRIL